MRSVDDKAEHFVLGIHVLQADSILRYREGDYNEKVFTKGDGNALPATPEEIIALAKRKYGIDNETTDIRYDEQSGQSILTFAESIGMTRMHQH